MSTATTHIDNKPSLRGTKQSHPLAPALRFKEFEGEWSKETLQGTCKKAISYGIVQTGEYEEGGIACVRVVDLTKKVTKRSDMICTTKKISDSYSKTVLEENELMLALRGEIGLVKLVTKELVGANLTRGVARLSTFENNYSSEFIMWLLHSESVIKDINKRVNGSALKEIPLSGLRKVKLTYPSLPEQQKIASFLSAVDKKIQQLTKKKALLDRYKKGVMQQLFSSTGSGHRSGKLRFKDDTSTSLGAGNGNAYPDWEEKRVEDFMEVTRGHVLAVPSMNQVQDTNYKYPVYSSQTKNNGLTGYYTEYLFSDSITWTTDGANAGEVKYRVGKFYCTNVCGVLKSNEGYANLCIAELLNTISRRYVSYVGNPKLMNNIMAKIKLSIPSSIKEQQKIAAYLSSIDTKIEAVKSQITQTQIFKKGLLQQLFV